MHPALTPADKLVLDLPTPERRKATTPTFQNITHSLAADLAKATSYNWIHLSVNKKV